MEQFTKIIEAIVWPGTVVFLSYMFRDQIQSLFAHIENFKLKYKDFELTVWRKELDHAKKEFEREVLPIPEADKKADIYQLVEASPVSAIIESWKTLENTAVKKILELTPAKEKQNKYRQYPFNYLEYAGALTPSTASAIRDLRRLRNKIIHYDNVRVAKGDAIEYVSLATTIENQIRAITELPKVQLNALTLMILQLNALIDSDEFKDITIDEAYSAIKEKRIMPFLKERTKDKIDLSMLGPKGPYPNFEEFYNEQMERLYHGYAGDHSRKWGVANNGLCLLLAWTNELVQQGAGWHPNEM